MNCARRRMVLGTCLTLLAGRVAAQPADERAATKDRLDLSGDWSCQTSEPDGADYGAAPFPSPARVRWPGTLDEAGVGAPVETPMEGALSRRFRFIGPAWYRREIEIPAAWRGRPLEFEMERVLWTSRVWMDGKPVSAEIASLATPHVHRIGPLEPGRHTITVRIDNSMRYRIGDKGHAYGEHMQTIWNGALGRIELRPAPALGPLRVSAAWPAREVGISIEAPAPAGPWSFELAEADGPVRQRGTVALTPKAGGGVAGVAPLAFDAKPWSDVSPHLYRLTLRPPAGTANSAAAASARFGFRTFRRDGRRLWLNDRPFFVRGNLDNVHFPLTGHPPTDLAAWRRILQIQKDNGINFIRFHSWCPPQAAFDAADEVGMLLQPEMIWIDGWMPGPLPGAGKGDAELDAYLQLEMRRIGDAYGNAPSFAVFCIGNELGSSNFETMAGWLAEQRARDPRRLYTCSTAREVTPQDDLMTTHHYPGAGATRGRMNSHTQWDFEDVYARTAIPTIAHEIGQWPVYPDWAELEKYTGVLRPWNLERLHRAAVSNGVERFNREFHEASLAQNLMMYKDEVEGFLRTPSCAGLQLLGAQDYSGQGEALIGWLDSFYDEKRPGLAREVRAWFGPTIPLARFAKYGWTTNESWRADLWLHHYGPQTLPTGATMAWTVRDDRGKAIREGSITLSEPWPSGRVAAAGMMEIPLAEFPAPARYVFECEIPGVSVRANAWPFWVFPAPAPESAMPKNVVETESVAEALAALKNGGRVWLRAHRLGASKRWVEGRWGSVYWSTTWFPGQTMKTLGLWLDRTYGGFAGFPVGSSGDWIWREICAGGRVFDVRGLPDAYRPPAMPVPDFHEPRRLAGLLEVTVGPGRLLISGYPLTGTRPEVVHLRQSLLRHLSSTRAAVPAVSEDWVRHLLLDEEPSGPIQREPGMDRASLYIECARMHQAAGDAPWNAAADRKESAPGYDATPVGMTMWRDRDGTYWVAWKKSSLRLRVPSGSGGELRLRFRDPNRNGRTGRGTIEGRPFEIPAHQDAPGGARWISLRMDREDSLDGVVEIQLETLTGPNLMLDRIAVVPLE